MRRIILSLSVALAFTVPFIGGCLTIGSKSEKVEKVEPAAKSDVRVEKETRTHTRTEVESTRP